MCSELLKNTEDAHMYVGIKASVLYNECKVILRDVVGVIRWSNLGILLSWIYTRQ